MPLPTEYMLWNPYPNPFNPNTTIIYGVPEAAKVKVIIYNLLGQKVMHLVEKYHEAGYYSVLWQAKTEASGMYIVKMESGKHLLTKKVLLVK